ncbi:MAG: MFS transporter [Qingshengfaniella sp.]
MKDSAFDEAVILPAPTPEPRLFSALALTTCSQITATSSVLALTTIPTIAAAALGIAPHMIGYQVSLIYASGVFFSMLASGLVKRLGAGRVGQLALIFAGCGFLGMATGSLVGIAIASVLIGIGYALNNPSSSHILARLAPPRRRNLIFSIKQAGVPLGGMLAALALPPLAQIWGWQVALLCFAALPLALAAIYQGFCRAWDTDRIPGLSVTRGLWRGQGQVWRDPNLRALAVLGFLFSGVQLSISTFIVAMLIAEFTWPALVAASVAAVLQASGAVGRVFWGLVADWVGSGFLVLAVIGLLTGLSALSFGIFGISPGLGIAVAMVSGLAGSGWNGVMLAETARASPGSGTLTGEVLTYTFVGVMVGPAAFSTLYVVTGSFTATFALSAAPAFLGCAIALLRHLRHRSEAPGDRT